MNIRYSPAKKKKSFHRKLFGCVLYKIILALGYEPERRTNEICENETTLVTLG